MSAPEKQEEKPAEKPKVDLEQAVAALMAQQEQTNKAIASLAEAVVRLNEKIEAKAGGGESGGGGGAAEAIKVVDKLLGGSEPMSIEGFARQAEAVAKAADAIERFRHPSRIGIGEALLMRAGLRAAMPRYMTKAELQRYDRLLGVAEVLEREETEHVSE